MSQTQSPGHLPSSAPPNTPHLGNKPNPEMMTPRKPHSFWKASALHPAGSQVAIQNPQCRHSPGTKDAHLRIDRGPPFSPSLLIQSLQTLALPVNSLKFTQGTVAEPGGNPGLAARCPMLYLSVQDTGHLFPSAPCLFSGLVQGHSYNNYENNQ